MPKRKYYHILQEDFTSYFGDEPAWKLGETRTLDLDAIELCEWGYHYSRSIWQAVGYYVAASNGKICLVDVNVYLGSKYCDEGKGVTDRRTLLAYADLYAVYEASILSLLKWAAKFSPDLEKFVKEYPTYLAAEQLAGYDHTWAKRFNYLLCGKKRDPLTRYNIVVNTLASMPLPEPWLHKYTGSWYRHIINKAHAILTLNFNKLATYAKEEVES